MDSPSTECLTGGEAVVRSLEQHKVRYVFGIPGDHTIPIYKALAASGIRHCTTRHEQGAGFMADGFARASGEPGVAIVIGGPGVTNIATAMGEAYSDGVPLLVISAETPSGDPGAGLDHNHEMKDQRTAVSGICASSERIRSLTQIPEAIARAFQTFRSGRPRSIHTGIPVDLLSACAPVSFESPSPSQPDPPDPNLLSRAAESLGQAHNPILLLGGGSRSARPISIRFAEAWGAPVMTTWNGKDAFPNDHPLYVGGGFHFKSAIDVLATADVVLAVGTQLGRSDFWHAPVQVNGKVIRVDIDPGQINANVSAGVGLIGDAEWTLEALLDAVGTIDRPGAYEQAAQVRKRIDAEADLTGSRYKPWLNAVRVGLPTNSIVAMDSTLLTYLGFRYLDIPDGGSWLYPSAYGTLGYALPAAIGARVSQPDRPAAVLIGDGGLLFTCSELLTATELGFGLPVVVWNDQGYGCIRMGMQQRGMTPLGVDFTIPDLAALARAFGGTHVRPQTPAEMESEIQNALARSVPTLIEVDDRLAT